MNHIFTAVNASAGSAIVTGEMTTEKLSVDRSVSVTTSVVNEKIRCCALAKTTENVCAENAFVNRNGRDWLVNALSTR